MQTNFTIEGNLISEMLFVRLIQEEGGEIFLVRCGLLDGALAGFPALFLAVSRDNVLSACFPFLFFRTMTTAAIVGFLSLGLFTYDVCKIWDFWTPAPSPLSLSYSHNLSVLLSAFEPPPTSVWTSYVNGPSLSACR